MAIEVDVLREKLKNFRTRAAAIDEAISLGEEAVEPAIELLHDRNEATRWSAIKILSEIGDQRAAPALIALLERGKSAIEAGNALRVITGQDLGDDADSWRAWAAAEPTADTIIPEQIELSDDALIRAATHGLNVAIASRGDRHTVEVLLPDKRKQRVCVDFSATDSEGAALVRLYTPCAKASADKYEWALKNNMNLSYGAIGLARIEGEYWFTMVNTHLRATVHPEALAKSILTLARKGDTVERLLSGEDKY